MNNNNRHNHEDLNKKIKTWAKKANAEIRRTKYLQKKLEEYKEFNILSKKTLEKICTEKSNSPIKIFKESTFKIKEDMEKRKMEYNNIYNKCKQLKEECSDDLSMGKGDLSYKKVEEFTLKNLNKEKDDFINVLRKSIKSSEGYQLRREPHRAIYVDPKIGDKKSEIAINFLKRHLLFELKKCNKYTNKIKKYKSNYLGMFNNVKLLNDFVEEKECILKKSGDWGDLRAVDNGMPDEKNKKGKNKCDKDVKEINKISKIINEFPPFETLFDILSEEGEDEKIIDNELHSDDETVFEEKIKNPKKLSTLHLNEINNSIPKFDFDQINFNKTKLNAEIDIYSIQRRVFKQTNIDTEINEKKKEIEKITEKIKQLEKKENVWKLFINKLKEKYKDLKPAIYNTTVTNISSSDFIINSLNKGDSQNLNIAQQDIEEDEKKNKQNLLENIEETVELPVEEEKENNGVNDGVNENKKIEKNNNNINLNNGKKIPNNKLGIDMSVSMKNSKVAKTMWKKKTKNKINNIHISSINKKKVKIKASLPISVFRINIINKTNQNEKRANSK